MKKLFVIVWFLAGLSCWAQSSFFTGDGGKGKSITILPPSGTGLAKEQAYLPDLVANELVSNFRSFSAMTLFDRVSNQKQYDELLSGIYSDNDKAGLDLGHLASTEYMLVGNITKTSTGYVLQLTVNKNSDKTTTASYSGTVSIAELDNLVGVRRASLDLLPKLGVSLNERARAELTKAPTTDQVNALVTMAQGIMAQRQGTEVAALSYFFQAAAFDPALLEASSRSSVLAANISSGNIGDNIRNDIQWRKDWIARLTETEQFLDGFNKTESMPYTLFYTSDIKQVGETNYRNETATIGGIETHLHGNGIWTLAIERTLQAVYDGLNATKRKDVWGLGGWPRQGVTSLNFTGRSQDFTVAFELLNDQNKVIGRQTLKPGGSWGVNWSGRPAINVDADKSMALNFQSVNANDITARMTIRVASVNGADAVTAARNGVLQILSLPKNEFELYSKFRFDKGEIKSYSGNANEFVIPAAIWGEPVISVAGSALNGWTITNGEVRDYTGSQTVITIPPAVNGVRVTKIGESAFSRYDNKHKNLPKLTSVTIPDIRKIARFT